MHDHEAETADQICAAETEAERLRAELAVVRAAVAGEPVPADASDLVKAIAGSLSRRRVAEEGWADMSRAVDEILANVRKIRGAAWDALSCVTRAWLDSASSFSLPAHDGTTVTIDNNDAVAGTIVRKGGERIFSAWDIDAAIGAFVGEIIPSEAVYAPRGAPAPAAPEDDGLTDADRDAGWRWETAYGVWHLYTPIGVLAAVVDDEGWVARVRGPESGAAGQRAAVAALRAAGVMPAEPERPAEGMTAAQIAEIEATLHRSDRIEVEQDRDGDTLILAADMAKVRAVRTSAGHLLCEVRRLRAQLAGRLM